MFFLCLKDIVQYLKKGLCLKRRQLKKNYDLRKTKKKIEFICEFSEISPTFVNGSIRKIEKTNISYIKLHKVIVKKKLIKNQKKVLYI